jgi:acyl dehydratase
MALELIGKKEGLYELVEIPEEFGPVEILIDDHKVKTYAFTQNDYNPWYFSNSPFGKRIAHSSILANDLLSLFLTKYDPNTIIGLHTQEELTFHSPIFVDEKVTLKGTYVDKYEKRGKGYAVMEAEARGEDGRLLVKHRGIEIMRVHAGSVVAKQTEKNVEKKVTGEYNKNIPPVEKAHVNIEIGTPIAPIVKHTSPEQSAVYSWAGRYVKNIHNNLEQAQKAGLSLPLVQGQQQVGYLTELLTNFFGASWFTSGSEKIKFIRPVAVGEVVTARGLVTDKKAENGQTRLELEVWVENINGELTAVGWADALIN